MYLIFAWNNAEGGPNDLWGASFTIEAAAAITDNLKKGFKEVRILDVDQIKQINDEDGIVFNNKQVVKLPSREETIDYLNVLKEQRDPKIAGLTLTQIMENFNKPIRNEEI